MKTCLPPLPDNEPILKKVRVSEKSLEEEETPKELIERLLQAEETPIRDLDRLRAVLHFKTALVSLPEPALSVYVPSEGKSNAWSIRLFGAPPALEAVYRQYYRHDQAYQLLVSKLGCCDHELLKESNTTPDWVSHILIPALTQDLDCSWRLDQLRREWQACQASCGTLANVLWQKQPYVGRLVYKVTPARVTVSLQERKRPLQVVPCQYEWIHHGVDSVMESMMTTFYENLQQRGYIWTTTDLDAPMRAVLRSTFSHDLVARFAPTTKLNAYLQGAAGVGKSSLCRHLGPALEATVRQHLDAQHVVQTCKVTLNKPLERLQQEWTIRPNNNDVSVAALTKQRAGRPHATVLVALEEVPPHQEGIGKLLENFDPTLAIYTSNYPCQLPQQPLVIHVTPVSGVQRQAFCRRYLQHYRITRLDLPTVNDTRRLVQYLRMVASYVAEGSSLQVVRNEPQNRVLINGVPLEWKQSLLVPCESNSLPMDARIPKTLDATLQCLLQYWIQGTLTPTVVVSQETTTIEKLVASLKDSFPVISVNAATYPITKCLYDDDKTSNLRDDLLVAKRPCVVHLQCPTQESQLAVREMLEDTPSRTAFSQTMELTKDGFLFLVSCKGIITPEIVSRASWVI